jgi:hypothetical protein
MKFKNYSLVFLSLISSATFAAEERSDITFDALPEAVRNTVSHFIDKANITKIEQVTDDGYVKFEIESTKTVDNKEFTATDMTVAADGDIMKLAKEAPAFAIPFPIMKQVNQRYPGLKVDEVEIIQTRYFIMKGNTDGQPVKLKIYDDGTIQAIETEQNPPQQPKTRKSPPTEMTVPMPSDSYQRVMPDEADELQIDRSDYNFEPPSDE